MAQLDKKIRDRLQEFKVSETNVTASDAVRLLEAVGYSLYSKGGNDHVYRRKGMLPVTVPYHRLTDKLMRYVVRRVIQAVEDAIDRDETENRKE